MPAPSDFLAALVAPLLALALGLFACAGLLLLWAVSGPRAPTAHRGRPPPAPSISSPRKVPVRFCAANGRCVLRWGVLISNGEASARYVTAAKAGRASYDRSAGR
jgi:hypothetical protein